MCRLLLVLSLLPLATSVAADQTQLPSETVNLTIKTSLGDIDIELYPKKAPKTVENFIRYVRAGRYRGGLFHRTVKPDNQPASKVKIEVIQGGPNPSAAGKDFPPILLERTSLTGVKHVDGAISMARNGPDTATSDFFTCIGPQPELDYGGKRNPDGQGFAAFGKVVNGMDVVKKIQGSPAKEQALQPPVKIIDIVRGRSSSSG